MIARKAAKRRVEEEIANAGALPQGNQVPPQEQIPLGGQVPVNPPAMTDGEIMPTFYVCLQPLILNIKP